MLTMAEQTITAAHRDLSSYMHRPTNDTWSHAKNQVRLTHFTGQNRPRKKWEWIGIWHYQASWASQRTGCFLLQFDCSQSRYAGGSTMINFCWTNVSSISHVVLFMQQAPAKTQRDNQTHVMSCYVRSIQILLVTVTCSGGLLVVGGTTPESGTAPAGGCTIYYRQRHHAGATRQRRQRPQPALGLVTTVLGKTSGSACLLSKRQAKPSRISQWISHSGWYS